MALEASQSAAQTSSRKQSPKPERANSFCVAAQLPALYQRAHGGPLNRSLPEVSMPFKFILQLAWGTLSKGSWTLNWMDFPASLPAFNYADTRPHP